MLALPLSATCLLVQTYDPRAAIMRDVCYQLMEQLDIKCVSHPSAAPQCVFSMCPSMMMAQRPLGV